MKTYLFILIIVITIFSTGCSKASKTKTISKKNKPSSIELAIDGMTGKTALKAGRHAKDTIKRVSAQANKNMEEIMKE